jgi:hypothetical protein
MTERDQTFETPPPGDSSLRPNRDQELEQIVDKLDADVAGEREAEGVPGKPSDREQTPTQGTSEEPPD